MRYEKSFIRITLATFAIALLTSATHVAHAQFGFSIGPKGGLAVTNFRSDDAGNIEAATHWFGGVFTNFQLGPVVALQPELLLTKRGGDVNSSNTRTEISLNYFEVPVLVKIRVPLAGEVIFPHILFGPNFAFRTDMDFSATDTQSGAILEADTDDIRKTDLQALVGAGVDIQTRGTGVFFTIDGRYGWGLRDLNDNDDVIHLRNAGWMFSLGIGFRVGDSSDRFD